MIVVDTADGHIVDTLDMGRHGWSSIRSEPGYALASNGAGTLTVVKRGEDRRYHVAGNVSTQQGARTLAVDPKTHRVYLPTAEFGPKAEGQSRPGIKPGSFVVLVYTPVQ